MVFGSSYINWDDLTNYDEILESLEWIEKEIDNDLERLVTQGIITKKEADELNDR
tara:strand:- start:9 stop:173 length:165 start_codon:yes stop_codon:yes gene_type:complete